MSISERRSKSRFLCADLVRVSWSGVACPAIEETAVAVLEDISAMGACVQVEQAIPLDAPITVRICETSFRGSVCYSVFRDYGYFVGIRFSKDTVWSHETVMPRHLTNLHALAQ